MTMNSTSHSLCFHTLRRIFHQQPPPATALTDATAATATTNPAIFLLDYRSVATFSALWLEGLESGKVKIGGQEIDLTDSSKQFLLIGNDPPDCIFNISLPALTGINFRSHFTATSWLAAWKVKFSPTDEEKKKGAKVSLARIAVIDPRPAGQADGVARPLQAILSARDAAGHPLVPGATVLNAPSLGAICQWLKRDPTDTRTVAKDTPHLRELLKSTIWNELTSKSEDHHALSNVLGPIILSGDKIDPKCWKDPDGDGEEQKQKRSVNAANRCKHILRQLLSACGLVSWADTKDEDQKSEPSETGKDLQILLLDDQAKQGWEDWVKEFLPGAKNTMQVAVDPITLVTAITTALTDDKGDFVHKDARFCLKLPELESATYPVLLLDLRLFTGKEQAEREFLKTKLLSLVNHFTDKPDLAWPGFSSTDSQFKRAMKAVESGTLKPDTDEHHEVLTWLPRVVALADMSLPIILFSSTGRRDLVEPFKPYGNIITCFEKPRLNDLAAASSDEITLTRRATIGALRDATQRARYYLKVRECLTEAEQRCSLQNASNTKVSDELRHFEVYFDESGSSRGDGFRVAALVVRYKSSQDADDLAKEMHDAGVSWFNGDGSPYVYDKEDSRNPHLVSQLGCTFRPYLEKVWLLPIVLWSNPADNQVGSDTFNADTLIQSIVAELLETALFIILPSGAGITYAIYGAQRRIPIPGTEFEAQGLSLPVTTKKQSVTSLADVGISSPQDQAHALADFKRKWALDDSTVEWDVDPTGFDRDQKIFKNANCKALFLSVTSAQDYGGILGRTFQTRPWEDPWKQQSNRVELRFSPLNHPRRALLANKDRPIHIIADFLPGDATWSQAEGPSLNAAATFFDASRHADPVLVAEGAELSLLLGGCRGSDGGDYPLAISSAMRLSKEFIPHATALYHGVWRRLLDIIPLLDGSDIRAALSQSEQKVPKSTSGTPFSRVHIRHQHWTRYPRPAAADVQTLEDYANKRLLIDFGRRASFFQKSVANWTVMKAVEAKYPGVTVSNIILMQDNATENLFAVAEIDSAREPFPYRTHSITLPNSLHDKPVSLSMGPVPVGRLHIVSGQVEWFEASPASVKDDGWTGAQIDAVVDPAGPKRLKPLSVSDAAKIAAGFAASSHPYWYQEQGGTFVLFVKQYEAGRLSQLSNVKLSNPSPEDFDPEGNLLHSKDSWPSVPTRTVRPQGHTAAKQPRMQEANRLRQSLGGASEPDRPATIYRSEIRWMMKQYMSRDEYEQCGADWHTKPGFQVLGAMSRNNPKITVFADSTIVSTVQLTEDFRGAHSNQLDPDGNPIGIPWKPSAPSRPRGTPQLSHSPISAAEQRPTHRKSEVNKAWIGPVPTGVKSDSLSDFIEDVLPGWIPESVWAGGVEQGWWLPISRETQGDSTVLPFAIQFGNQRLNVSTADPNG